MKLLKKVKKAAEELTELSKQSSFKNFVMNIINTIKVPVSTEEIGIDSTILPLTFKATKDIRDKYVLSRLAWDLGIIEEVKI